MAKNKDGANVETEPLDGAPPRNLRGVHEHHDVKAHPPRPENAKGRPDPAHVVESPAPEVSHG